MASTSIKQINRQNGPELGIPGLEHYSLRDYKQLLVRKKWVILSVAFVVALLASTVAYFLPNKYQGSTVVMVDPSKVSFLVRSTSTLSAAERLALLQQQILSDSKLTQVIDELSLYSDSRKTESPDIILLRMRKDILIEPVIYSNKDLQAFKVSFFSQDPNTAARVANRLASLFIEENLRAREQEVFGTAEFFNHEWEKAKDDLAEKARKLDQLKARYASDLPEAQTVHLQALNALQLELREEIDSLNRAHQQKMYLQASLADTPAVVDLDSVSNGNGTAEMQEQLGELESQLDGMRSRYGPEFPDVLKKEGEIAALKRQIAEQQKSVKSTPPPAPPKHTNPVIESQIAAIDQEIQGHLQREKDLKSQIDFHQSKLQGAPAVAGQIAAAQREYDNAEDSYKRLQDHKFAADVTSDVESRQKGERFVILQPAQPPSHPSQPNRVLIDLVALAAGIPIGVFAVLGLEMLDSSIKTGREISERLRAPVFGEIPWLETPAWRRRQRLRGLLALAGNAVLALGYLGFLAVAIR
jgi:polysaccharide chain length determinant protein (PEP-CTERM system associated)